MTAVVTRLRQARASAERTHTTIEPPGGPPHDGAMEARVAVLEQIAKSTEATLVALRGDLKEMRDDTREARRTQDRDFRIAIGATIATALSLAGLMAKGFRWF